MKIRSFTVFIEAVLLATQVHASGDDPEAWRNESFMKCLNAFEEKSLEPAADGSVEVYRVFYLPSFFPQVSMHVEVAPSGRGRMTLRSIPSYCSKRGQPI